MAKITIMQGDSYKLPFSVLDKNGQVLDKSLFEDIEVMIGGIKYNMANGDVEYDTESKTFCVFLSQKDTFKLSGTVKTQCRVKTSGDGWVFGKTMGILDVIKSQSRAVL